MPCRSQRQRLAAELKRRQKFANARDLVTSILSGIELAIRLALGAVDALRNSNSFRNDDTRLSSFSCSATSAHALSGNIC